MTAIILRGDARNLPLADASVDLICTSPPFYALRSYTDGGEHYAGQLGAEPTPAEYIDNLIACTREWMRVLRPTGSLWINLGDKYSDRAGPEYCGSSDGYTSRTDVAPRKSLIGLPWRYALRCIDELGLILRAEVIWSKPNGLPESVTDRVRRSHEQWFHFTRSPRYYAAVDRIRHPHIGIHGGGSKWPNGAGGQRPQTQLATTNGHPLGALPGSVWTIPTQPLKIPDHLGVDHFAAFPMEWPRRIVQGWSPEGICTGCGEGRRPVSTTERTFDGQPCGPGSGAIFGDTKRQSRNKGVGNWRFGAQTEITGEVCACPDTSAPTRPGVVLDPFSGTGTTALVAHALGRIGVGVDMSQDYCRLAQWRTTDPGQYAAALEVDKPARQIDGQDDLLALLEGP